MLLLESEDGFKVYHVTEIEEFNKLRPYLLSPVSETIAATRTVKTTDQILNEMASKIEAKLNDFGLFIGTQNGKITALVTVIVVMNDNMHMCCLMHFKYFRRNGLKKMMGQGLPAIVKWAKERYCLRVQFITARGVEASERLLNGGGFIPEETIFVKEI